MLTLTDLMALVGFAVTCFALGYAVGRSSRA